MPWAAWGGETTTASTGIQVTGSARSRGTKTPSWFPCSQTSPPFKSTVQYCSLGNPCLARFPSSFLLPKTRWLCHYTTTQCPLSKEQREHSSVPAGAGAGCCSIHDSLCRLTSPGDLSRMRRREGSSFCPPPFCQESREYLRDQAAFKTHKLSTFFPAKTFLI